ncbi:hypothetical protein [Alcaligenes endophyticus]|uniref:Uncharacterized protein n=1 Tax=Alcaligenes endophyticus TaxID=1929088 RepID=A0ABT8EFC5_9BURK|nr:hypothetical protein [Alcaligenes endophyticus]MCX5590424.1 hypothetical protein [Alcaligenes endophyticus]MDN4119912.1 hypothetical protein [Alcaligenes endophyticus]
MSWRLIIAILLLAAGASVWGGMELGNWLIAHGPQKSLVVLPPDPDDIPLLNADGRPYTAQPPQPLADGRLGVPQAVESMDWQISTSALEQENPPISLATTSISLEEAISIAMKEQSASLQGIAQVDLTNNNVDSVIDIPQPPPPSQEVQVPYNNNGNWQAQLQQELRACSNKGFFDRPSCSWEARNKYCAPNNAWGRVEGCPSKAF